MLDRTVTTRQLGVAAPAQLADAPTTPQSVQTATKSPGVLFQLLIAVAGFAVVLGAWALASTIDDPAFSGSTSPTSPVEGLTIFAVFFVAAAGLERLLEPFSSIASNSKKADLQTALGAAAEAWKAWQTANEAWETASSDKVAKQGEADAAAQHVDSAMQAAADAKGQLSTTNWIMTIGAWSLACSLGILAAAVLKLYLLRQVGIAAPSRNWELLATGLIIGAGTKPLHDLVTLIEKKKEAATTTPTTAP